MTPSTSSTSNDRSCVLNRAVALSGWLPDHHSTRWWSASPIHFLDLSHSLARICPAFSHSCYFIRFCHSFFALYRSRSPPDLHLGNLATVSIHTQGPQLRKFSALR